MEQVSKESPSAAATQIVDYEGLTSPLVEAVEAWTAEYRPLPFSARMERQILRFKERHEMKLTETEFGRMLYLDFEHLKGEIAPVPGPFDPEDRLQVVRQMPHAERRAALADYSRQLACQRLAWAECRIFLERSLRFNNDQPRAALEAIIGRFSNCWGFTERQCTQAGAVIDGYYAHRQKVLKLWHSHSEPRVLLETVTGRRIAPDPHIQVELGPMSIDIGTHTTNLGHIRGRHADDSLSGCAPAVNYHESEVQLVLVNTDRWERGHKPMNRNIIQQLCSAKYLSQESLLRTAQNS